MMDLPEFDAVNYIEKACEFIRNTVEKANSTGVVLGLSGGIDSAVVAYLAVKALGVSNVKGYILPSKTTSVQDLEDAKVVKNELGIGGEIISIEDFHVNFLNLCSRENTPKNNET
jgi:NAD+ synthase